MVCGPRLWPHRPVVTAKGAREKFSPPPATATSLWPDMICCAAEMMACVPEPQARFTLSAALSSGSPALIAI